MAAIPLTESVVRHVKRTLRERFPNDGSSHISEALAAGLGFRTNIALMEVLRRSDPADPDYVLLEEGRFLPRLAEVAGRPLAKDDRALNFDNLRYAAPSPVVTTRSAGWRRVDYSKSRRLRAWRNAMVAAINEAISQRFFTVRPGDNRWPDAAPDGHGRTRTHVFDFEIAGIPGKGSIHDAGYDELAIHAALWPSAKDPSWVKYPNAGFEAGEVFATGWLERRDGAWLQVPKSGIGRALNCRRERLDQVAALDVAPQGYADRGSFKM